MTVKSLEEKIADHTNVTEMLNMNPGGRFNFPIAPEFSNWRDEQTAWSTSAILQDMSFHMTVIHLEGPDVYEFIARMGVNSFASFGLMQAKQIVCCNEEGYFVGDAIITSDAKDEVAVIGRPEGPGWIKFHAENSDLDVRVKHVELPSPNLSDRLHYRFQVQGPNADKILEELNGGPLPEIDFFKMGKFNIGPYEVIALNHRMSGAPGFEFWGPSDEGDAARELIYEVGAKYGMKQVGGRVYSTTAKASGWMSSIVPAIYTSESTKAFRETLDADGYFASAAVGGSYTVNDIGLLYVTPWDVGYGFMVKFDHDFIGREALEKKANENHLKKVRLLWNAEDVTDIYASYLREGTPYKYMEMPVSSYATYCFDEVLLDGKVVGMSDAPVYTTPSLSWFSLAMIEEELAVDGKELTLIWGEPDGGSDKPAVEKHQQKTVRVIVDSKPVKRD